MERRTLLQRIRNPSKTSPALLVVTKLLACVIPSAQIAIGALYLSDCPQQHYIPIYLVVMGAFGLALALLSDLLCAQDSEGRIPNLLSCVRTSWNTLTSLFLFCWFISGNVWIYSIYQPNYNQTIANYNQTIPNYNQTMPNYNQTIPNYNQTIPNYDQSRSNQTLTEKLYCNRTLYLFAFWINTLLYILLGVLLVWGCCLCAWNLFSDSDTEDHSA